ncbi:MAG: response regulator transcription factor [Planctomycetota bacterium]
MRTLVIEDDVKLSKLLRRGLTEAGFSVDVAMDGEEGLFLAKSERFDAILLDLMIPKLSGRQVLAQLRAGGSHTPVLILTARDGIADKVDGLNCGADDYLTKPFTFEELVARLRALIRRTRGVTRSLIRVADLEIDTSSRSVARGGRAIVLPAKQYALLELLALSRNKIVTRTEIYDHIYSYQSDTLSNVVDVHICKLRNAVDRDAAVQLIHTVRGHGYVLKEP